MIKKLLLALAALIVVGAAVLWLAARPDVARLSNAELTGRVPVLSTPRPERFPTARIAEAIGWPAGGAPRAPAGLAVSRFASGLAHPRTLYVLPNGDVLVAETAAPQPRGAPSPTKRIERLLMSKAGAVVQSANRITLLRDADGDGVAEVKTPFITGLNSPYGMALVGSTLYVANTDALLAFDYTPGTTRITTPPRKIVDLPASGENRHWTKSLVAAPDGLLYVGIGSNSNIGDNGLAWERGRAQVIEVRPATRYKRAFATGLRNPAGLAINPATGRLWAAVNERDQLGSDMVPDYMSELELGQFYGWPWYYWGGYVDDRVKEPDSDDRRQYVARPGYALGTHVAPLGISFASAAAPGAAAGNGLGAPFGNGAFIALHGSWNRVPIAGYKVVFVPFGADGQPRDVLPIDILSGFVTADGKAMGRPADARQGRDGALLVADDVGNIIWRVAPRRR